MTVRQLMLAAASATTNLKKSVLQMNGNTSVKL